VVHFFSETISSIQAPWPRRVQGFNQPAIETRVLLEAVCFKWQKDTFLPLTHQCFTLKITVRLIDF
jgi:hypothetical protein